MQKGYTVSNPTNPSEDINKFDDVMDEKPVIYLYPEETLEVTVKLNYNGEIVCTYPTYNDGWTVTAHSDGTLIKDGKEYSYLFWEGNSNVEYVT